MTYNYLPVFFNSIEDFHSYFKKDQIPKINDISKSQIIELNKIRNPHIRIESELKKTLSDTTQSINNSDYSIVYYPWRNRAVKTLGKELFIELRTSRNLYKITREERDKLRSKHIVVIGLSVGKAVAQILALERVCGKLTLVDFDTLETTNMNRIMTSIFNVGEPKAIIVAREIAEMDPFIELKVELAGISEENIAEIIGKTNHTHLVVEVCDSLEMKIAVRKYCKSEQIPVVMDTSDKGMLDIERFDLNPNLPILHGRLKDFDLDSLNFNDPMTRMNLLFSIVDFEKVSEKAKHSFSEIGKTLTTWPQLGSSIYLGAASTCVAVRKILLGQEVKSGRYYIDLDEVLK